MVNNDLMSLVNARPLKFWKETRALLCTFAQGGEWAVLCDMLASKLMVAGETLAAALCYICAGNIDKTVEIWSRCLAAKYDGKPYVVDLLHDLMEKAIVLALATGQKQFSASLCKLVEKYAEILASQGLLTTVIEYLKLFGSDDHSPELVILKDCIAHYAGPDPPVLRNADQYQQPPTLGSQLYPGDSNLTYPLPLGSGSLASIPSHVGSVPGPKMPQVVAPPSAPRGFMPVTSTSAVQTQCNHPALHIQHQYNQLQYLGDSCQ
ncbi:hypothetical protein V6N12_059520 [Hibiscus sabdariffa]|uniref:Ancestral coatomer element 1 Sec16/Sec31 domain-containing protein n=1 Tax=Hibiscus sabdariffa TaxID=183260 RepID=A0ABR2EVB1_9ROSI